MIKEELNENLVFKILETVESMPYCSSNSISINNHDNYYVLAQLKIILQENLILAEPAVDEYGEINNLFNIRLTLKGLKRLKKFN